MTESILPQADRVYLVDNGSDAASRKTLHGIVQAFPAKVTLVQNEVNLGVATALNAGIAAGRKDGFDWFLLLDHDSVAAPDMVGNLIRAYESEKERNPGIVSAWHVDSRTGRRYHYVSFGKVLFRRVRPAGRPVSCSFCMTSGSLVRKEVFDRVGTFREDYFVYAVDNEFCRRVRSGGFEILVSDKALLYHREGDARSLHFPVFFLYKAKVAMNDGKIFGEGYEHFVRLNFGAPRSIIAEGLERMVRALQEKGRMGVTHRSRFKYYGIWREREWSALFSSGELLMAKHSFDQVMTARSIRGQIFQVEPLWLPPF